MTTRVLVPSGVLGLGFDSDALARGIASKPEIISIDGGSTDSGPFYLGTGTSKYADATIRAEWRQLMLARREADVPLVLSSCGTCGVNAMVDAMFDLTCELAHELGHSLQVARIYSEQSATALVSALGSHAITALQPELPIYPELLEQCSHVVALAGVEPIQHVLDSGADIVLCGRATDTAPIAALPLLRGEHAGAAWHAAKIGECGALCTSHPMSGVILLDIDDSGFTVTPTAEGARCTSQSVFAHMLYENADPFVLHEPGGYLDVTDAAYEDLDDGRVRVTGSQWHGVPYTIKLEGSKLAGYGCSLLAVLRDRHYVQNVRQWASRLQRESCDRVRRQMNLDASDFSIEIRLIGMDACLGELETADNVPHEVGVLVNVLGPDQEQANDIGRLVNPLLLHLPLTDDEPLPTFSFPYSPAQSERGPNYEFCLNHLLKVNDPLQPFEIRMDRIPKA